MTEYEENFLKEMQFATRKDKPKRKEHETMTEEEYLKKMQFTIGLDMLGYLIITRREMLKTIGFKSTLAETVHYNNLEEALNTFIREEIKYMASLP